MTPPLPEILDSAPGAGVSADALSEVVLVLVSSAVELLALDDEEEDEWELDDVELDDEVQDDEVEVVVCAEDADVTSVALEEVAASGSELPQPVRSTAAMAAAIKADLEASMHFITAMEASDQPRHVVLIEVANQLRTHPARPVT